MLLYAVGNIVWFKSIQESQDSLYVLQLSICEKSEDKWIESIGECDHQGVRVSFFNSIWKWDSDVMMR